VGLCCHFVLYYFDLNITNNKININAILNGIHMGDITHHQLHCMMLQSLRTINAKSRSDKNEVPFFEFELFAIFKKDFVM